MRHIAVGIVVLLWCSPALSTEPPMARSPDVIRAEELVAGVLKAYEDRNSLSFTMVVQEKGLKYTVEATHRTDQVCFTVYKDGELIYGFSAKDGKAREVDYVSGKKRAFPISSPDVINGEWWPELDVNLRFCMVSRCSRPFVGSQSTSIRYLRTLFRTKEYMGSEYLQKLVDMKYITKAFVEEHPDAMIWRRIATEPPDIGWPDTDVVLLYLGQVGSNHVWQVRRWMRGLVVDTFHFDPEKRIVKWDTEKDGFLRKHSFSYPGSPTGSFQLPPLREQARVSHP